MRVEISQADPILQVKKLGLRPDLHRIEGEPGVNLQDRRLGKFDGSNHDSIPSRARVNHPNG